MTPSEGCSVEVLEIPLEKDLLMTRSNSVRSSFQNFFSTRSDIEIRRSTEMMISEGSPRLRRMVAHPRVMEGVDANVEPSQSS
eukprot:CAMPEP_0178746448 /NCGR_PEP_ID=MMETSP0744-20121128/7814_1 /TAXON_ID=913974 /ORGANISM="Nitzschia punctata, Strain CCMP561" /LENGTH=82 /DNA_ID=CAMNT_0020399659 /DNA_START=233 /DNA_END=481 /DNA_ORIENTATION=-